MEELLTVRQVANEYRVSEETVRRWIKDGVIPYELVKPFRVRRKALGTPVPVEHTMQIITFERTAAEERIRALKASLA